MDLKFRAKIDQIIFDILNQTDRVRLAGSNW